MIRRVSVRKITIIQTRRPLLRSAGPSVESAALKNKHNEHHDEPCNESCAEHFSLQQGINEELQWFGSSLGLFGLRDKDKSCFRIFVELLKAAKEKRSISSNEISARTGLARGTVVHHLNNMLSAGIIIISRTGGYRLRVSNLEKLIDEIQRDTMQACGQLRQVAKQIDEGVGLR